MQKARLSTTIDEKLLKDLKILAVKENKKLNAVLEEAIKNYLDLKAESN